MFSDARDTYIQNGTFTTVAGNYISREDSVSEAGWAKLAHSVVTGAMHNSLERSDSPRCHPETRVAVQGDIMSWINYGDVGSPCSSDPQFGGGGATPAHRNLMWVTGPAGTGKTAILTSIAEICDEQGTLAASFFFSFKHAKRNSKEHFVPTLAYQLGLAVKGLRPLINNAVREDGTIFSRNIKTQFEFLILKPVWQLMEQDEFISEWPKAIVVDALDECGPTNREGRYSVDREDKEGSQYEVLSTLVAAASHPHFPFRILIASRAERVIRTLLKGPSARRCTHVLTLDRRYNPDADIALLLRCRFAEIRRQYGITANWPREGIIALLVDKASGQFIYAATVLRFIQNAKRSPREHLNIILDIKLALDTTGPAGVPESPTMEVPNPFAQLDALYTAILQSTPDPSYATMWLHIIDYFSNVPQYDFSNNYKSAWRNLRGVAFPAAFVDAFMEAHSGDAERVLGNLHSIVHVPDAEGDNLRTIPYSFYHKSLVEFLKNPLRSKELYIREDVWRDHLFRRYIAVYPGPNTPRSSGTSGALVSWKDSADFASLCGSLTIFDYLRFLQEPTFRDTLLQYDISSWAEHQLAHRQVDNVNLVYRHIHSMCTWYRCKKLCRRWRKRISSMLQSAGLSAPAPPSPTTSVTQHGSLQFWK